MTSENHAKPRSCLGYQTLALNLSSKWTNDSVELEIASYRELPLVQQALWADISGKSFYAYDGGFSSLISNISLPINELWHFTPSDDTGTGSWTLVAPRASSNFSALVRITQGVYTSSRGADFALGGIQDATTTPGIDAHKNWQPVPGLVTFNTSSQLWSNASTSGYSHSGFVAGGSAHVVSSLGRDGLLFVLGGVTDYGIRSSTDFISFYVLFDQQWYSQAVTGDKPVPMINPCVEGSQGDGDTYEVHFEYSYSLLSVSVSRHELTVTWAQIFLYGGLATDFDNSIVLNTIFILSIPGFFWYRPPLPDPSVSRYYHTCNVIGSGRRQLISVGGCVNNSTELYSDINNSTLSLSDTSLTDPWRHGLGIFDMTELRWRDSYDPDLPAYTTPTAIKSIYARQGKFPKQCSDPTVQKLFTEKQVISNMTSQNPNSTPPESEAAPSSPQNRVNQASIAGATDGSVAMFIFLITSLIFYPRFRRRRRSEQSQRGLDAHNIMITKEDTVEYNKPELVDSQLCEMNAFQKQRLPELMTRVSSIRLSCLEPQPRDRGESEWIWITRRARRWRTAYEGVNAFMILSLFKMLFQV